MARSFTIDDLYDWDARIRDTAAAIGLDWFTQEFHMCDHRQMLGAMAYSGMPAHYPHWSFGKAYEKQKTLYDYGVSGLPYEMVINSDPSIAYLMRGNSLCLQILTIAHVYGHNDFFKNNFTFRHTQPELRLSKIKGAAERVRSYIEDPSIGIEAVEQVLDAAHALALQCRRNMAIRKPSQKELADQMSAAAHGIKDPFAAIHKPVEIDLPDRQRVPLEPEEDLLLLIRDNNLNLQEWQKDLLTIAHEDAQYFMPQIETKIINEGWATFCHHQIMNRLDLAQDLHLEFLVRHNQVVRPTPGQINPYHVGFHIWSSLFDKYCDEDGEDTAWQRLHAIREVDRDASFLRRFLDQAMLRELDLFSYDTEGSDYVVKEVGDDDGWRTVKDLLIRNVGSAALPVLVAVDCDHDGNRILRLRHEYEGRDLQLDYAQHTLKHLFCLWEREVILETKLGEKDVVLSYSHKGFASKPLR